MSLDEPLRAARDRRCRGRSTFAFVHHMFTTGSRSTITPYHKAEFRKLMVFHEQALRSGANQRECVPMSVGKGQDLEAHSHSRRRRIARRLEDGAARGAAIVLDRLTSRYLQ